MTGEMLERILQLTIVLLSVFPDCLLATNSTAVMETRTASISEINSSPTPTVNPSFTRINPIHSASDPAFNSSVTQVYVAMSTLNSPRTTATHSLPSPPSSTASVIHLSPSSVVRMQPPPSNKVLASDKTILCVVYRKLYSTNASYTHVPTNTNC